MEVWIMIELWIMERQFKIDPIKTIPNNVERVQDLDTSRSKAQVRW